MASSKIPCVKMKAGCFEGKIFSFSFLGQFAGAVRYTFHIQECPENVTSCSFDWFTIFPPFFLNTALWLIRCDGVMLTSRH